MSRIFITALLVSTAAFVLMSCSGNSSDTLKAGSGTVRIHLTDAPSDYLASAEITVSHIYLMAGKDDSTVADSTASDSTASGRVDIYGPGAEPLTFDLLELRDGLEAFAAEVPVTLGTYHQLRLVVDEATVTLREGYTFTDSSTTRSLKTPSAHTSGIKVDLNEPIEVEDGMITLVVVDFEVDENFKLRGNPDSPAGIKGVLFTPRLKEKRRDITEEN